ncbi:hypothetical protein FOA52_003542 [Chlamydomonas sp. UWO 241]|nr:hypothetical protein FOA52_003542 [Chlamydomonas sp. UWO 241]
MERAQFAAFADSSSGEWEGVIATFDADGGKPQPLPERFVPNAFAEWGVVVADWQAQTSMLASAEEGTLQYRVRRMMPTVGCEADAVAWEEESQVLWAGSSGRPVLPDGSYMAGPSCLSPDDTKASVEVCLALPNVATGAGAGKRSRVRVVTHLTRHGETKVWRAARYEVSTERYDTEYRGGGQDLQLLGCHGTRTISDGAVTSEGDAEAAGSGGAAGWRVAGGHVYDLGVGGGAGSSGVPRTLAPGESPPPGLRGWGDTTRLPEGLFGRVTVPAGSTEELQIEIGAVVVAVGSGEPPREPARRRVARVMYTAAGLATFLVTDEQAPAPAPAA